MGAELNGCGNCTRILLVVINLLFIAIGIAILGVGIWLLVTGADYSFFTGNRIVSGAALLIIAAGVTFVICVIGILGAALKWRPMLVVYAAIVAIIVILEIAAGIFGFVYRNQIEDFVDERGRLAIEAYRLNDSFSDFNRSANNAVNFVQSEFTCCGYNNATDWVDLNFQLTKFQAVAGLPPPECPTCNEILPDDCMNFFVEDIPDSPNAITFNTTKIGCRQAVIDRVVVIATVTGGVGIVFGLLEILGILLAIGLCCCITRARDQQSV